jgi:hypothetical protein
MGFLCLAFGENSRHPTCGFAMMAIEMLEKQRQQREKIVKFRKLSIKSACLPVPGQYSLNSFRLMLIDRMPSGFESFPLHW